VTWPISKRAWHWLHAQANRLAWRVGMEPGWRQGMWGSAAHTRKGHWSWRLNDWLASHWVDWWMTERRRLR
jgi:hypothetical protein